MPTVADRERLLRLARAAKLERAWPQPPPIEPVDRNARLPLSFAQQRLWFLEQLGGMGSTYSVRRRLRMRGALNRAALIQALNRIVARHEALRTTFPVVDGAPEQRIASVADSTLTLIEHDLTTHQDPDTALRGLVAEEAVASFDLARGPLIRGRFIRIAEHDHVLLLTMHHIVSDAWSSGVFIHELNQLYRAFCRGESDPLPRLPVQYADYAMWQRQWVDGPVIGEQAAYWKRALAGAPTLLELPTDRPRPARQQYVGTALPVDVDEELTAALKTMSTRHGTTLFMTVLAAWAVVLSRLSAQPDVVIGTPSANRHRREIEGLIGFFLNTLPLRIEVADSLTVAELLARVREQVLSAQQNQDIPFERVVDLVQPTRSAAHAPIFQVMLTWQNTPRERLSMDGLQVEGVETAAYDTAKFDLLLTLQESGGRIRGTLMYANALFDAPTIERHAGYLRQALQGLVGDDVRRIGSIDLLSSVERQELLRGRNHTAAPYPRDLGVHQLFEAQAQRTPDAVAVVQESAALTYAELNERANRLAHDLIGRGVGPDVRVGVYVDRSLDLIVGVLGVLKAGGAYVPLDPSLPDERVRDMLDDCQPALILSHRALAAKLRQPRVDVVMLDDDLSWTAVPETNPSPARLHPENLVYVIYTSGSTGRPKGVMNVHRNVTNRITWMQAAWQLDPGESVLQNASLSFDVSASEILWPLSVGARVVMMRPHGHRDIEYVVDTIRINNVTIASFVPAMLQLLLESPAVTDCTCLTRVQSAGDSLMPGLARRFVEKLPGATLFNRYGPTEAATTVTGAVATISSAQGSVPMGRPGANTETYLLNSYGQLVPSGAAGELYIGGEPVGRGYWRRPDLTAEYFVADPFSGRPGARLYRTGDLCRWTPEGQLEFLGRRDMQVKVRGLRVELGEIEARLREHPDVRDTVVVAREDAPGDKRLAAYYVANGEVAAEALRARLTMTLPEYMVPAAYVRLDALPLTPSGKVDRLALPAPEADAFAHHGYEPPDGPTEAALAEIWSAVLRVPRVGRHDHFFELGGHSLLAAQMVSRVRQLLGVEVPLGDVLESPVLTDFARVVESAGRTDLPAIEPVDRDLPLPLSFAQQRLWFLEQLGSLGSTYYVRYRLRLRGELDRSALRRALDRIIARHEVLRTSFTVVDGVPAQRIAAVADSALQLLEHDLSTQRAAEAELRRLVAIETDAPFDLARGPVIRGRLIRLDEDDHVLLLTMHHIVSDAWSVAVLIRELSVLYGAYRRSDADPLPPLLVQYADYAAWQRQWVDGDLLEAQVTYWREALAGAPDLLRLPTDRRRPARQDYAGSVATVSLSSEQTTALKQLSQRHGITLFTTLLAAWGATLHRLSGQDDIVIGTPTANRSRTEIEALLGYFVNMLALRIQFVDAPTVAELLAHVKERLIDAQQNQDVPFEQVVERLQPRRSLAHGPIFQVMFAWQSVTRDRIDLPGLQVVRVDAPPNNTAKYDLSLALSETQDGRISGTLTYATALFDSATVARFLESFRCVLDAMLADDRQRVESLPVLADAPATETEIALAEIWSELLGVPTLDRRDNFFAAGGHSLLAVQMVSRVRLRLGVEAALADVFESPILTDFARIIESAHHLELTL